MKYILAILSVTSIGLSSCSNAFHRPINGIYNNSSKDFYYSLSINDSSFSLIQNYFEANSSCSGKWQKLSNDTLFLRCEDAGMSSRLQSGYMSEREKKVIIRNRNKIQIGKVILKRVK